MHYAVTACPTTADFAYYRWLRANYPSRRMLRRLRRGGKSARGPLISIVMPVFRPPPHCLRAAIDSALRQSYRNWELCIVDDGSADAAVREVLAEYEQGEPRIRIRLEAENRGISAASNRALAQASGEFVTFVDHDDVLPEHALQRIADVLVEHPSTDVLYTDEDKCTSPSQVESPFFKPDWCPDSLLSRMYTMHLAVYRRSLLNELGGLRSEFDGAQDYDLILRASELTGEIRHLPEVLYHWRILPASIASGPDNPKAAYAYDAAERALADALRRRHASATVVPIDGLPCAFRVRYTITAHERVSIHIVSRDNAALLERCVNSIRERTRYENYEIVLVDHGSREASTAQLIDRWKADPRFRSVSIDIPFNHSQLNNLAVEHSSGRVLLFLHDDTEVLSEGWIEAMLEQAQRPAIGAVGALLLFPNRYIQHAGVLLGLGGLAAPGHRLQPASHPGYFGQAWTVNNYSAVTGACLMCRRNVFEEVGRFDERFAVHYGDVDLCLRMAENRYRNVYLPHVTLLHHESSSCCRWAQRDSAPLRHADCVVDEAQLFATRWQRFIAHDPCYSPHLSRSYSDYRICTA